MTTIDPGPPEFSDRAPIQPEPPVPPRSAVGSVAHQQAAKTARFSYTREQKGHSLILNLLLIGPLTMWITTIYWSISPRHYWHA